MSQKLPENLEEKIIKFQFFIIKNDSKKSLQFGKYTVGCKKITTLTFFLVVSLKKFSVVFFEHPTLGNIDKSVV